jgi:hypothetical protein
MYDNIFQDQLEECSLYIIYLDLKNPYSYKQ